MDTNNGTDGTTTEATETVVEGTDGTEVEADAYVPPTKEEFEATKAALAKANAEAAARRIELKKLKEAATAVKVEDDDNDAEDATDEKPEDKGTPESPDVTAIANKFKKPLVRGALRDAVGEGNDVDAVLGLIKFDDINLDDDGNVTGLNEQVEALKAKLPGLFAKEKPVKSAPPTVTKTGGKPPTQTLTATEIQLKQMGRLK